MDDDSYWHRSLTKVGIEHAQRFAELTILSSNSLLPQILKAGYKTIFATPWYLDQLSYGSDWTKFYETDPTSYLTGRDEQLRKLVVGGEVREYLCSRSSSISRARFFRRPASGQSISTLSL